MEGAISEQLYSDESSNRMKQSNQCIICLGFNIVYTKDIKTLKDTLLIDPDGEIRRSSSSSNDSSSSNSSRSLSSERGSFVDVKRKKYSSHNQILKGLLHCIWKNDHPYFVFYISNEKNGEEMGFLVANQAKKHNPRYDCVYSFHSRSRFSKGSSRNSCSSIVGEMKVTGCVSFGSNGTVVTDREFVLYGIREHHHHQQQRNTLNAVKFKRLSNLFKSQNPNLKTGGEVDIDLDDFIQESWLNDQRNHTQIDLELAAVVIKDTDRNTKRENTIGGWGLKFLEKSITATDHVDPCIKEGSPRYVNVVLPAGIHGGEGRSSLVERWMTGGHCDCGGWDIGCPLTVLNNKTRSYNKSSGKDSTAAILFQEVDCSVVYLNTFHSK